MVTVCKINTQEPEEPMDFEFCSTNVTNKVPVIICLFVKKLHLLKDDFFFN